MEGHRRYADDSEPSWYAGQRSHDDGRSPAAGAYDSGVHERPSGAFRLPEQRPADDGYSSPYVTSEPGTSTGSHARPATDPPTGAAHESVRLPLRGPQYPTIRPNGAGSPSDAPPAASPASAVPAPTSYGSTPSPAYGTPASSTPTSSAYGASTPTSSAYGASPTTAPSYGAPVSSAPASYGTPASGATTTFGALDTPAPGGYGAPAPSGRRAASPSAPGTPGATAYDEATGLVSAVGARPESVYRTRRPVSSMVVAAVTAVLMVPAVMLLIDATFGDQISARGVVPAVLLTLGLPLTGVGLFTLAGGGPSGRDVWLRPPVAYLPVGLFLLLAAGLAIA